MGSISVHNTPDILTYEKAFLLSMAFCSWDSERNVSAVMGCNKLVYLSPRRSVILFMCIYGLFNGVFQSSLYIASSVETINE